MKTTIGIRGIGDNSEIALIRTQGGGVGLGGRLSNQTFGPSSPISTDAFLVSPLTSARNPPRMRRKVVVKVSYFMLFNDHLGFKFEKVSYYTLIILISP